MGWDGRLLGFFLHRYCVLFCVRSRGMVKLAPFSHERTRLYHTSPFYYSLARSHHAFLRVDQTRRWALAAWDCFSFTYLSFSQWQCVVNFQPRLVLVIRNRIYAIYECCLCATLLGRYANHMSASGRRRVCQHKYILHLATALKSTAAQKTKV